MDDSLHPLTGIRTPRQLVEGYDRNPSQRERMEPRGGDMTVIVRMTHWMMDLIQ